MDNGRQLLCVVLENWRPQVYSKREGELMNAAFVLNLECIVVELMEAGSILFLKRELYK